MLTDSLNLVQSQIYGFNSTQPANPEAHGIGISPGRISDFFTNHLPTMTTKAFFTTLNIIYFAICLVMLLFGAIVYYLVSSGAVAPEPDALPAGIRYVVYVLAGAGVAAGYFIYRQMLAQVDPSSSLRDKLNKYQGAILVRSACLEAPALFAAVCTMLAGELAYLTIPVLMAAVFVFLRPTPGSAKEDLQSSDQEASVLMDQEGKIE
jgi:hypothetical protein